METLSGVRRYQSIQTKEYAQALLKDSVLVNYLKAYFLTSNRIYDPVASITKEDRIVKSPIGIEDLPDALPYKFGICGFIW